MSKAKLPEIQRLIRVIKALGGDVDEIAKGTGVSARTMNNVQWGNLKIGGQLLRGLNTVHGVSIDWLLTGTGTMFVDQDAIADESPDDVRPERLMDYRPNIDDAAFPDAYFMYATLIEQSLLDAGSIPGVDYNILDLYRMAQPHVLAHDRKNPLKTDIFFHFDRNACGDEPPK